MSDNLEALYAQWLAGGSPRVVNPVDVRGPSIAPMSFANMGGDGGASGFAGLSDGIMSYLDNKKKEKEKAAGNTGVSDAPPPDNTFGGGGSQYQGHPTPPPEPVFGGGGAQYRPPPTSAGVSTPDVTTLPLQTQRDGFGGGGEQYQTPPLPAGMTPEQAALLTPAQLAWIFANTPR